MIILEVAIVILALLCAYPMVVGAVMGRDVARAHLHAIGDAARAILPWLAVARWCAARLLAPRRVTGPAPWPYVEPAEVEAQEEQRDPSPSCPSASSVLIEPGSRLAAIEALVKSGWTTAQVRGLIKGENATIGQEVEAARTRLGVPAPARVVTIRNGKDGEVML